MSKSKKEKFARCHICNTKTEDWQNNVYQLKSQHSTTLIIEFIQKLIGDFASHRTIEKDEDIICDQCLNKIEEYDWTCVMAERFEKELRELLLKTEALYANQEDLCKTKQSALIEDKKISLNTEISLNLNNTSIDQEKDSASSEITNEVLLAEITAKSDGNYVQCDDNDGDMNDVDDSIEIDDSDPDYVLDDESDEKSDAGKKVSDDDEYLPGRSVPKKTTQRIVKSTIPSSYLRQKTNLSNHNSTPVRRKKPKTYTCFLCNKTFQKIVEFMVHERWHKKQKIPEFRCETCRMVLDNKNAFDDHVKLHQNKPPLECIFCGRVTKHKYNLYTHMKIHTGKADYQCDICGKLFLQNTSFDAHMKFHFNMRAISCPHCPMTFNVRSCLMRHLQTHRKEKPYSCKICGNKFGYKTNLNDHMKLHTGNAKPYKCTFCSAAFARKTKLNQHLQKNHGTLPAHLDKVEEEPLAERIPIE